MKMKVRFLVVLFVLIISQACSEEEVVGSNNVVKITPQLGFFDKISIEDNVSLDLRTASEQSVFLSVSENVQDEIIAEVRDQILYLGLVDGAFENVILKVEIQLPRLERLAMSDISSGNVEVNQDSVEVVLEDAVDLTISGFARILNSSLSDASKLNGFDLTVDRLSTNSLDASELEITCLEELAGTVNNVAKIRYLGSPEITASISDAATVTSSN